MSDDAADRRRASPPLAAFRRSAVLPLASGREAARVLPRRLRGAQARLSAGRLPPRRRRPRGGEDGARRGRMQPRAAGRGDALAERAASRARHAERHRRARLVPHAERGGGARPAARRFRWCAASAQAADRQHARPDRGAQACVCCASSASHGTCACRPGTSKRPRPSCARIPDLPVVLNHTGFPWDRSAAGLEMWRRGMKALAACEQVYCKLSCLCLPRAAGTTRTTAAWCSRRSSSSASSAACSRPIFRSTACACPSARMFGDFKRMTAAFSASERRRLFHDNAALFYAL